MGRQKGWVGGWVGWWAGEGGSIIITIADIEIIIIVVIMNYLIIVILIIVIRAQLPTPAQIHTCACPLATPSGVQGSSLGSATLRNPNRTSETIKIIVRDNFPWPAGAIDKKYRSR